MSFSHQFEGTPPAGVQNHTTCHGARPPAHLTNPTTTLSRAAYTTTHCCSWPLKRTRLQAILVCATLSEVGSLTNVAL